MTNKHFEATFSYYHDELTWCVQKSQPIAVWKRILRMCLDPKVLAIHTAMCFCAVLAAYFFQQYENSQPRWDWNTMSLKAFSCFCGVPIRYSPKNVSSRVLFTFFLFGSLIFGVVFNGYMAKSLTTPSFFDQITSIKEIVDNRFELTGDEIALHHLIKRNQVGNQSNFCFVLWA